jgi:hypothetical protein
LDIGLPGTNGTRPFEGGWLRFSVSNYAVMGAQGNGSRPFYNRDPLNLPVASGVDSQRQRAATAVSVRPAKSSGGPRIKVDAGMSTVPPLDENLKSWLRAAREAVETSRRFDCCANVQ